MCFKKKGEYIKRISLGTMCVRRFIVKRSVYNISVKDKLGLINQQGTRNINVALI